MVNGGDNNDDEDVVEGEDNNDEDDEGSGESDRREGACKVLMLLLEKIVCGNNRPKKIFYKCLL